MSSKQNQTNVQRNHTINGTSKIQVDVTLLVFLVFVCAFIIALNVATIVTFSIARSIRRRSVYCMINLAVADMMHGGIVSVICSLHISAAIVNSSPYLVHKIVFALAPLITLMASLFSLVIISLERVYATFFPFRHRTMRTRSYYVAFAITWLLAAVVAIWHELFANSGVSAYNAAGALSLHVIIVSYIAIFIKVKRQNQQHQQQAAIEMTQKRERDLALTMFIMTAVSLLTCMPYFFAESVLKRSHELDDWIFLFQLANSLLNPVVYVFRMKDFKKELLLLMCKCFQRPIHPAGNHGSQANTNESIELRVIEIRVIQN